MSENLATEELRERLDGFVEFGIALMITGIAFSLGGVSESVWGDHASHPGFYYAAASLFVVGVLACCAPFYAARIPDVGPQQAPRTPIEPGDHIAPAIEASHATIATQFSAGASLDGQLIGLLVVLATVGGVFGVVQHALGSDRFILLVGVGIAALICLSGMRFPLGLEAGPDPAPFYRRIDPSDAMTYMCELLLALEKTIEDNEEALEERNGAIGLAITALAGAAILFGLVRGIAAI